MSLRSANTYTSVDINGAVKLRIGKNDSVLVPPTTIPHFFRESCEKYSSQPALRFEEVSSDPLSTSILSKWIAVSYAEFAEKVDQVALMLLHYGLKSHDVVGIIASNSPEWLYAQFGTLRAGGIIFGANVTSSEDAIQHMLGTSSAVCCIVENAEQMAKVQAVWSSLPKLRLVIQIKRSNDDNLYKKEGYYLWEDLMSRNYENYRDKLEEREKRIYANECAMLLYTSGTTGMPKAVMLSHDNLIFSTIVTCQTFPHLTQTVKGSVVSYLPLCHIVGQIYEVFTAIQCGACIHFAKPNALKGSLVETLRIAKPTHFFGVPRVFEKQIHVEHRKMKPWKLIGMEHCNIMWCGGAPLSADLKSYFNKYGLLVVNCYGLSETAAGVTFNTNLHNQSIGQVIKHTEVKTVECGLEKQGELCFRGRKVFMGYLNEPMKTNESIDPDGWFHTGDAGYLDSESYVFITARIKELVITSGGENIPPVRIEEFIKMELPGISNAMVVGDQHKYLTVLLTIKTKIDQDTGRPLDDLSQEAIKWLDSLGFKYRKLSEVLNIPADIDETKFLAKIDPKIHASIEAGILRANTTALLRSHRIQKFALLPHDFSVPTEELGPTLKLRRNIVLKKYAAIIDRLYE